MPSSIVQELIDHCAENPEFAKDFEQSFTFARRTNVKDLDENKIDTLNDYFRYLDEYVNWVPTEDRTGAKVYSQIALFYFVLNYPPLCDYQSSLDPSGARPRRWLTDWIIRYAQEMGKWMDTPESLTPETLKTFYDSPSYHMEDYPLPPSGWNTFNQFFARRIDPVRRPVANPDDDSIVVSPADCRFDGSWRMDAEPEANVIFHVKGVPWRISDLLDDANNGKRYGDAFAGGTFSHSFLGPTDYHRQHAPVSGKVLAAKVIPGICYLQVVADDSTSYTDLLGRPSLKMRVTDKSTPQPHGDLTSPAPPESLASQFSQARGLILIDSPIAGLVAVMPIGMAQVSSVVLTVKEGDVVKKGEEISYFQFGGSAIVMVFQKGATVKFQQREGQHYKVGTKIGTVGADSD